MYKFLFHKLNIYLYAPWCRPENEEDPLYVCTKPDASYTSLEEAISEAENHTGLVFNKGKMTVCFTQVDS